MAGTDFTLKKAPLDELVKVSSNDTVSGNLLDKIVAGTGITVVEVNDGGDETLRIDATGGGGSGLSNYYSSESISSTSSGAYQDKIAQNTTNLAAKDYVVHYSIELLISERTVTARV